jgi:dTDP-4-dehydrorhamnose 3,5-epimerase-like enzyme
MNIELIDFDIRGDNRGSLIALEQLSNIPFEIKRVYYIFDTQSGVSRGFHAHRELKQVVICVNGSCKLLLDDGHERQEVTLESPNRGLLITSMIWREMFDFSPDCVLLVLASELYEEADYIRDYQQFIEIAQSGP